MTEEELAKLKEEHGDLVVLNVKGTTLVFRTPADTTFEEFQDKLANPKASKAAAFREICLRSLVSPSQEEAKKIFEKLPALPARISNSLTDLAGAEVEIQVKKG